MKRVDHMVSTVGMGQPMMDMKPERFAIYVQIFEGTFAKTQDPYRYPTRQDSLLTAVEWTNKIESQEDESDHTGVRNNTRRRLKRMHARRRRSRRRH